MARAVEQPAFRRVVLPRDLEQPALVDQLAEARRALVAFLGELDMTEIATMVRQAAVTDLEYTT
ncbi:hypothetical protein [Streptomyces sp. NPDC001250]|uniref:hypothetical protein n=1 Tax=unclassified Streptomyces TaxID=2593676 RepID=UPI00332C28BE